MTLDTKNAACYFIDLAKSRRDVHETNLHTCPEMFVTLGHRLRHVREQLSLSQLNVAHILGVGGNTVREWESDRSTPSWFYIQSYSIALDIPLLTLLDGVAPTARNVHRSLMNKVTLPPQHTLNPPHGGTR